MFSILLITSNDEQMPQSKKDKKKASTADRRTLKANTKRNRTFMPNSAGTTAAASDANRFPSLYAIKINAITMVEGSVPRMPPVFDP